MFREATSEQSLVREGAGYDEVFQLGHEPKEGFSWSSERETSTYSLDDGVESYGGEGEEGREEGKDEGDEGEEKGEDDRDEGEIDGDPLKKEVQEAPGMATLIHLFFPKCGLS